ncbi:MAG: hypothetical protein ACI8PB_000252 [Desulforhopalus sp.]|jgi:hypothetical protein
MSASLWRLPAAKHLHFTTDADKQHSADFLMIEKKVPFFPRGYREEPTADFTTL